MKSSTELVSATSEAAFRLVQRNIEEKGKQDKYIVGAMDGYLQGYCDGVVDNINLDKAIDWLVANGFFGRKDSCGAIEFRKAMTEQNG